LQVTESGSASAALSRVPFGDFLELLRRNGFSIGLRHYARAMTVLDRMGPECSPNQVRTLLCPVFATTAEQQDRFYRLFNQWFPLFVEVAPEEQRLAAASIEAGGAEPEVPASHGPPKRRKNYLFPMAAAAVVLIALSLPFVSRNRAPSIDRQRADSLVRLPPPAPSGRVTPQPVPDVRAPAPPPTQPAERQTAWRFLISRSVVQSLAILIIGSGLAGVEWRNYRRRRIVLERQRRERPPLVWPIRVESVASPLTESSDFYTAARRLRDRQTGERSRLDIESSITATIRALGFPMLQYVLETRPPEYLVLIERASARDHQSRLYQHLVESLASEGVHATVYCYDDDPRICDPVSGGPVAMLSELRRRYPTYRLLLFGTGDGLIDPITGRRKPWVADALSWPDRALLTPEPVEAWGAREVALASHLVVLPATINGLQAAIDHFQMPTRQAVGVRRQSRGPAIPELSGSDHVRLLRRYVGERGLQWVCACAVYPELQWNLTLHLGMLPELGNRTIDDNLLLKLVRLPWYRTGLIPDDARTVLLRVIRPEVERAARGALITLLERNPAPAETIASSRYELDLVVQKLALLGPGRARRRELARIAQRMPRDRVVRELAVLRLTEYDPPSRLAMQLPGRLRQVFFQSGLPVFGLTTAARSLVALALVGGVVFAGRVRMNRSVVPVSLAGGQTGRDDTLRRDASRGATTAAISDRRVIPLSLSLSDSDVYSFVGDEADLRLVARMPSGEVAPVDMATAIEWRTSDSSVATVSARGRVRALKPGLTSISAIVRPSSQYSGGVSARVYVLNPVATGAAAGRRSGATDRRLDSAIALYERFNVERAKPILQALLRQEADLSRSDAALAHKYLGAAYAVLARPDSAIRSFVKALDRDPFTDLDPTSFATAELSAFSSAKRRVFKVGVRVPTEVHVDSLSRFYVVTTQRSQLRFELISQADSTQRIEVYNGLIEGLREIPWNGEGFVRSAGNQPTNWEARATATASGQTGVTRSDRRMVRLIPPVPIIARAADTIERAARPAPPAARAEDSLLTARSETRLQEAINHARTQLSTNWTAQGGQISIAGVKVEFTAISSFESTIINNRVRGTVIEIDHVCGVTLSCAGPRTVSLPNGETASVTGLIRFEWRDNFGRTRSQPQRFRLTFVHQGDAWVLRGVGL
jgi:tetratricopeptide (TPR) repeat protein